MISIYIATWNVSTKYPDNISLNELLDIDNHFKEKILPDLYIVGFQEVNANPQNIVTNFFVCDPWVQKLKDLLKPLEYFVVKTEQLQGLLMVIFVKRKHLYHIREIESEYTKTGFGGMWGNKGAVVIRMNIYGCSMCVVNSHLAAHDQMLEERINDYQRIKDATKFSVKVSQGIFDHDFIFWFGDLNFRLLNEDNSTPEEVRDMVKKDQLSDLLRKDQLMEIMCQGRAFSELVERPPQFPPTFKFEPGTNEYDMKRRPAWCDRILYKAKTKILKNCSLELEQISYKSHPNYKISDHKPVSSEFKLKVKEIYRTHFNILKPRRQLTNDYLSNAAIPILSAASLPIAVYAAMTKPNLETQIDSTSDDEFYDAPDYFSDSSFDDDDDDIEKVPEDDVSGLVIKFRPLSVWNNSEENQIEYILPPNYVDGGADWIGVYRESFTGFDEYIGWEYTVPDSDRTYTSERHVKINFSDSINLPLDGKFIMMYFQSTGSRGFTSMIGMSDVFSVIKRCPSPRPDTID